MFEAIRRVLIGAWRDLRARGLIALFFFELFVVTLGVVLAQGVADWAGNRDKLAAMEKARSRADLEMGDAAFVSQTWRQLGPCLQAEINTILRSAASGEQINGELLERPGLFTNTVMPLSEQTKLLIRDRHGDVAAYNYDRMQRLTTRFDIRVEEIVDHWARLAQLSPDFGAVSVDDRSSARGTAVAIKANLTTVDQISEEILKLAARMNLEPKILGEPLRFSRNCRDYYRSGREFAV